VEPPTTAYTRSMPSVSSTMRSSSTQSATRIGGKFRWYGSPVAGSIDSGEVVPYGLASTLTQITKKAVRVQRFVGTDVEVPPAGLAVVGVVSAGGVRAARKRVAQQDDIALVGRECAVGLVGGFDGRESLPVREGYAVGEDDALRRDQPDFAFGRVRSQRGVVHRFHRRL